MAITREQRLGRVSTASSTALQLYDAEENGIKLFAIFQKHQLPQEKYRTYAQTVGDVILGFYPQTQLPNLLQEALGVNMIQAGAIYADLKIFLAPLQSIGTTGADLTPTLNTVTEDPVPTSHTNESIQITTSPSIPSYRKPLTSVPRYQNPPARIPVSPQIPAMPPTIQPISTPPSQPPIPPRM